MKKTNNKIIKENKNINNKLSILLSKWGYFIVIIAVFAVYAQTLSFQWTNCDDDIIRSKYNEFNKLSNITKAFSEPYFGGYYYRPVIVASFIIDSVIGGDSAFIHHFFNLIFHLICCLLLLYLFKLFKYNSIISVLFTLVFASHPLFSNAVSWILGRNDVLMTLFGLLSFIFLIKYKNDNNKLFLILNEVSLLLSLLSKEASILLPLIFIAYLLLIHKDKLLNKDNYLLYAGWVIVVIIWYLLRKNALSASMNDSDFAITNLFNNIALVPTLISKFIFPLNNAVLPTYSSITTIFGLVILILLISIYFKIKIKRNNYILFGCIFFLVFAFPGMFISLNGRADYFDYLDCRAYLPMIGLMIVLIEIIPNKLLLLRNNKFYAIHIIIIILIATINISYSKNYDNPIDFFNSAVKSNPERAKFHCQLGLNYLDIKKNDLAEQEYLKAVNLNPNEPEYFSKLGLIYYQANDYPKAISIFEQGMKAKKVDGELIANLGSAYNETQQYKKAISVLLKGVGIKKYEKVIYLSLTNAYAYTCAYDSAMYYGSKLSYLGDNNGLMNTYLQWAIDCYKKGSINEAIEKNTLAIKYGKDNDSPLINMGVLYMLTGNYVKSEEYLKKALELNKTGVDALNNLLKLTLFYTKDYSSASNYANEIIKRGGTIDPKYLDLLKQYK